MKLYIFCGKGGVGKTSCAVSLALRLSEYVKTAIVDYDGGHSVARTLGIEPNFRPNSIYNHKKNLALAVIENQPYSSISDFKVCAKDTSSYFAHYFLQFPDDLGLIPLADMVNTFFGVPTDIPTLEKFLRLCKILRDLDWDGVKNVVIDVEPTAGLQRLLSNVDSTIRSLKNLQGQGGVSLFAIGTRWPDIGAYLRSSYILNVTRHCFNLEEAAEHMKKATYYIVSTPEAGPVAQAIDEVQSVIKGFGADVRGVVVNNVRGEEHEAEQIHRLKHLGLPMAVVERQPGLHIPGFSTARKERLLLDIGTDIYSAMISQGGIN